MAKTVAQFAGQAASIGPKMDAAVKASVGQAALTMKKSVQAELRRAIGADLKMSNVGRRAGGAKIGVTFNVKDFKGDPTALLKMTGPAQLVERDTDPHPILPRGVGRVQGRRTKANRLAAKQELYNALFGGRVAVAGRNIRPLRLADGNFRYIVNHPGTKGKFPWAKGTTAATPAARKILSQAPLNGVKAAFNL